VVASCLDEPGVAAAGLIQPVAAVLDQELGIAAQRS
jgi:hypothetical protein